MHATAVLPPNSAIQAPSPPPKEPTAEASGFAEMMDQTDAANVPVTSADIPTETGPDGLPIEGEASTGPAEPIISQPPPYWPSPAAPQPALSPEAISISAAQSLGAEPEGLSNDAPMPGALVSSTTANADIRIAAQPGFSSLEAPDPSRALEAGSLIVGAPPEASGLEAVIAQQARQQLVAQPAGGVAAMQSQAQIPAFWSLHLADPVARPGEMLPADIETVKDTTAVGTATALAEGGEAVATTLQPIAGAMVAVDSSGAPDMLAPPQSSAAVPGSGPLGAATLGAPAQTPAAPPLPPGLPNDLAALISARPDGPVDLQLFPEELGHLRLSLTQDGDILRVTIQAERAETLDLLRRHSETLMDEIRMAGFSGGTFNFSGWQGPAPEARQSPEHASLAEPAPSPQQPETRLAQSGLDLRL